MDRASGDRFLTVNLINRGAWETMSNAANYDVNRVVTSARLMLENEENNVNRLPVQS